MPPHRLGSPLQSDHEGLLLPQIHPANRSRPRPSLAELARTVEKTTTEDTGLDSLANQAEN